MRSRDMPRYAHAAMPGAVAFFGHGFADERGDGAERVVDRRPHALDRRLARVAAGSRLPHWWSSNARRSPRQAWRAGTGTRPRVLRASCCRYSRSAPRLTPPLRARRRTVRSRARQRGQAGLSRAGRTAWPSFPAAKGRQQKCACRSRKNRSCAPPAAWRCASSAPGRANCRAGHKACSRAHRRPRGLRICRRRRAA